MSGIDWMLIYPCGNRSLVVADQVGDWEEHDYDLASRRRFDTRDDAEEYGRSLTPKFQSASGVLD